MRAVRPNLKRAGIASVWLLTVLLTGCIHVVPFGRVGEVREAKALAKTLRDLAPEAKELLAQEHEVANALKITLDELTRMKPDTFQQKFNSYADRFIAIRNRRQQIADTIGHGVWQSPMVIVVQQKAIKILLDEIARNESWIRLAQNVRLRAELGRDRDFPEFATLSHQLDGFQALAGEDPLGPQLQALEEEFRFNDGALG